MGQAKQRGTYKQRVQAAQERNSKLEAIVNQMNFILYVNPYNVWAVNE
jgi:hypothetical protein